MRFLLLVPLLIAAPQDPTVLRVAWGDIQTLDPALAINPQDVRVVEALFDGLGSATAAVDGPVITFKLADRKWSDGRPVKASDYVFAWRRALDPSTGSPWAFRYRHIRNAWNWHESELLAIRVLMYESEGPAGRNEIVMLASRVASKRHVRLLEEAAKTEKEEFPRDVLNSMRATAADRKDLAPSDIGVEAIDDRTLRVTLESVKPGFPQLAATTPFFPAPEHVVKARRDRWTHPDHLVTCGAFSVERWTQDGIVLARSGAGPDPARVTFANANRIGDAWPLYERGAVDWIDRTLVPPEKIPALLETGELRAGPGPWIAFLRLSESLKPSVRKAVAQALDRPLLAKKAGPGSEATRTLMGGAEALDLDLAAAMVSLANAYPDLKVPPLRLLMWKGSESGDVARSVRDQLEEGLALSIRIDLREGPSYQTALAAGNFDLAFASYASEVGDPAGILDLFPDGRKKGEKALVDSQFAIPLIREGEWIVAKPRVIAKPGDPLSKVTLKK